MAGPTIQNPAGAFGLASMSTYDGADLPAVTVATSMQTAVSRGEVVALGTTIGTGIRCLTGTAAGLAVGVALQDAGIGKVCDVAVGGPVINVKKDTAGALTAGNKVQRSTAISGTVALLSGATVISSAADIGACLGIVVADASAAATSVSIYVVKL